MQQTLQSLNLRLSVRWKLIFPLFFIALLVVGVLLPVTTGLVARRIQEQADDRLSQVAQSVNALIRNSERQSLLAAEFVANLVEVRVRAGNPDTWDSLGTHLDARRETLELQELSFYAADFQAGDPPIYYGGPVVTSRLQVTTEVLAVRNTLILNALQSNQPVSSVVVTPQSSQMIGVAPVYDLGDELRETPSGATLSVIFLDKNFLEDASIVLAADIAIVSHNAVVASTINQQSGYELLLQQGFIDPTGAVTATNIEVLQNGETTPQRLLAYPLVVGGSQQGTVLVSQDINDFVAVRRDVQTVLALFAGAVALATIAFGAVVLASFARPLETLAEATREVSQGNLSRRVDLKLKVKDEVTDLSENFNVMAERLQDLVVNLEQQVQERTRELAIARDQALEASRAKSTFLANMSHELRTPLNAIIGYSEMLRDDAEAQGMDNYVDDLSRVYKAGDHLLSLINDILDLSKIEAGKMELYLERFGVPDLISQVETTIQPMVERNNNRLQVEYPLDVGSMYADITKVRQVLLNLLSNASKFTNRGTITFKISRTITPPDVLVKKNEPGMEWVVFNVTDTGIGMTPEQLERVFEEFAQADASTTREFGGTGLGLTISRRFCQLMGGDIFASSQLNVGSTFTVWLPTNVSTVTDAPVPVTYRHSEDQRETHVGGPTPRDPNVGKSVLVIDDDPVVLDMMKRFLSKEGFNVVTVDNGADGLELARKLHPAAITLDVMMPGMDGWQVLSLLKGDPTLADIPVVMITIIDDQNMGYTLGATDYITKPVNRERVAQILNRISNQPATVLVVEDDDASRQLLRRILEQEDCRVVEAENGRAALERMGPTAADVILLDLMMPEMDGFEFLEQLKVHSNTAWRQVPVIVVTAKDLTDEDHQRLNGSVTRIIAKGDSLRSREVLFKQVRDMVAAIGPKE